MRFLYLSMFLTFATITFAQKGKVERAHNEYKKFNFDLAAQLYLETVEKVEDPTIKINLANIYRLKSQNKEAEYWYSQVMELSECKPIYMLYYSLVLRKNGNCELAKQWIEKYEAIVPFDPRGIPLSWDCDTFMSSISFCENCYQVKNISINTKWDDYSPVLFGEGIVFISKREMDKSIQRGGGWSKSPFWEVFYTQIDTLDYFNHEYLYHPHPKEFEWRRNTKYNDGPIAFSKNQSKIIISRNNFYDSDTDEEYSRLKIFLGDFASNKTNNIQGLPFNSDEYSTAYGVFGKNDNILFFSSDMPGGFGGMDLYYSIQEEEQWGPPINLGPVVNDEKDQIYPFYHPVSNKLYFTSDGHDGFGGLDIYYTETNNDYYSKPVNLGKMVNSPKDDFSIYWNEAGDFGYFTSNREGGKGSNDIYSIKKNAATATLNVIDKSNSKPISKVIVKIENEEQLLFTNENGQVILDLPFDDCFIIELEHEKYEHTRIQICTKKTKMRQVLEVSAEMKEKE